MYTLTHYYIYRCSSLTIINIDTFFTFYNRPLILSIEFFFLNNRHSVLILVIIHLDIVLLVSQNKWVSNRTYIL